MDAHADNPGLDTAHSINSLGLDLYREQIKTANGAGVLLSPYSIAVTLAMIYIGADGVTKAEMQEVLHLPSDPVACSAAFQSLADQLDEVASTSEKKVTSLREGGGSATPIQLNMANRIFAQRGYVLRPDFVGQLQRHFGSNLAELDFRNDPVQARQVINEWVEGQTHRRIRDLLPVGQPEISTRLTLVNALYFKAAWADEFAEFATKPEHFLLRSRETVEIPMMLTQRHLGYVKRDGYTAVTIPYLGQQIQFVLIVPDAPDGLGAIEHGLTTKALNGFAQLGAREVKLHLPKFKLEPATMPLGPALQALGLRAAFDQPKGSANFDRIAPRMPDDYLYIGPVFHKTWLALDEHGTEAAAATVIELVSLGVSSRREPPPVEVWADRPFLFAIQHVQSGTCLFLGRVTDPR